MSKDNSDSFKLSRRKALAGMGSIGLAGALGIGGTYAQFTDTEQQTATFSAGGIDGTLVTNASYNGEALNGQENPGYVTYDGEGAGATIHFEDVKPGDFGSFNFTLEVTNNPAWVASCVGITSDTDDVEYEPESEIEEDGFGIQSSATPDSFEDQASAGVDIYGSTGAGELAENLYMIPFYDSDATSSFFDSSGPPSSFSGQTTADAFWDNSEGNSLSAQAGDGYLQPRTVRDVYENVASLNTQEWNDGAYNSIAAPQDSIVDPGCVLLDGAQAGQSSSDNTREASALQPGDTLHFGYDWHVPFDAGNELQGDELQLSAGFTFAQLRHTSAPEFSNVYAPGENTPSASGGN